MKFRKKPVEIEAVNWATPEPAPQWYCDAMDDGRIVVVQKEPGTPRHLLVQTTEGTMRGEEGDWIIRGVEGELYPCKPSVFAATYEGADTLPGRPLSLALVMSDLKAFHIGCNLPTLDFPGFPSQDRIDLRDKLLKEEVTELDDAIAARDILEVADALGDIMYIAAGTALEFGIPLDHVWDAIHMSNMAKINPETGKAYHFREDGKVLKPEGWTPPDIAGALNKAAA